MPIYEYVCGCGTLFERLELSIKDIPTSQCPECGKMGRRMMSRPSIVYEVFDERATHKLPDWNQKMARAEASERRVRSTLREPLPHDMGQGIKVYDTEFGKTERRKLEQKAQLDNMP